MGFFSFIPPHFSIFQICLNSDSGPDTPPLYAIFITFSVFISETILFLSLHAVPVNIYQWPLHCSNHLISECSK